jgi:S-formylglutathione hydrolase FrmB
VDFTYVETPGGHEWDFWDAQVKAFLDWLPLGRETT